MAFSLSLSLITTNFHSFILKPNLFHLTFSSPIKIQSHNLRKDPFFITFHFTKQCKENTKRLKKISPLFKTVMCTLGVASFSVAGTGSGFHDCFEVVAALGVFVGSIVGMEFWARWTHRAIWHGSFWCIHKSHHRLRDGTFELNDVFAIINSVPAIAFIYYGYFNEGIVPELCFAAGLGITVLGLAYVLIHDGLIHGRFPVGPIADVWYIQTIVAAHKIHHTRKFGGVPYGFFLGPMELQEVVGGLEELEKEITRCDELKDGL